MAMLFTTNEMAFCSNRSNEMRTGERRKLSRHPAAVARSLPTALRLTAATPD
jgi:hypothetical protein